ncbi:hypothetical protein D3C71_1329530 [compost metagenome]
MILLIDEQRAAVFQQGVDLEIPVIQRFAYQEITAAVATAPSFFHHVDITVAVAIQIVRGISGVLDKGILIKREHIVGFKAPHFDLPVIFVAEEEYGIIEIHFTAKVRQWLN